MSVLGTRHDVDDLEQGSSATFDLIICHDERIVLHDVYGNPHLRLRMCLELLTSSDVVATAVDSARAEELHSLFQDRIDQASSEPDQVINAIAKHVRRWGVQIYVSTTHKKSDAPAVLYSVVTEYGPGQIVVEHFPDRQARTASLIDRAEQFFTKPDAIPELIRTDEQRLAALVSTVLMPATITLAEANRNEEGAYLPSDRALSVR